MAMNLPASGKTSFFSVLVHDIGHALGLSHSLQRDSVMYPSYEIPPNITHMAELDLAKDDIYGIQYLYGYPVPSTTTTTTTTSTTSQPPPDRGLSTNDLCVYKTKLQTVLIVNNKIFMFHNKKVWVVDMEETDREPSQFNRPKIITQWLPFLPHDFVNITTIYGRPNDKIVLFTRKRVYFIHYPSLKKIFESTVEAFLEYPNVEINAVVNGHTGLTYILAIDLVFQVDECKLKVKLLGVFTTVFPDLPKKITSAFRYTNGRL
ncbi:72 kDa type IV collagenase-like [Homalodisca vitripennis]|uniref:72 kDa type IV collagenase-like n=1 Tax=Homalodisca vitripennis TaxID=197043 RepID=UPI001EEC4329|nr:72 kDa type IV collagenase-like [Homalodisca vitripennis]